MQALLMTKMHLQLHVSLRHLKEHVAKADRMQRTLEMSKNHPSRYLELLPHVGIKRNLDVMRKK